MTAMNPDAKGQHPSNESGRVQPRTEPKKAGLDAAADVEIQRQFNELRSELLKGREKTVNWWLAATAIFLTLLSVVVAFGGYLTFGRFHEIETEARENVANSKKYTEDARSVVEDIKAKRDEAESIVKWISSETVGKEPKKAREAAESVQENPVIDQAIAAAVLLQEGGKSDEAIEKWRSIASITEEADKELTARAWFSVGYLNAKENNLEEAIDAYSRSIRFNENLVEAYNNRGVAKDYLRKFEAAIEDFNRALELKPDDADVYSNRGASRRSLGQHQAAIADYDEAIRLNPNNALAYYNRGNAKHDLDRHQAALADYDEAIRLNPNYFQAYHNRGNAKYALGQHQAALADYDVSIRLDPNFAAAYYHRGNAKHALGQHQAALADYDVSVRLDPNFAAAYYHRGLANLELHQVEEARQDFEKVLALAQKAGNETLATEAKSSLQNLDKPKDS